MIYLIGPMASGKSTVGKSLATALSTSFADSDAAIVAHHGTIAQIFAEHGEAHFRDLEVQALCRLHTGVVATGGGAVLDDRNRALMREHGFVVYLQVGVATQLRRLARDRSRPLLACGDREPVLRKLAAEREPLYREVADLAFDTGEDAASTAAARLAGVLALRWQAATGSGDCPMQARGA